MPLVNGTDASGRFWKYGSRGHKYYYVAYDSLGNEKAKKLAIRQGVAISYSTGKPFESRTPRSSPRSRSRSPRARSHSPRYYL